MEEFRKTFYCVCKCVAMCLWEHVSMCQCVHVFVYVCVCLCICVSVCTCQYVKECIHMYMFLCLFMCTCRFPRWTFIVFHYCLLTHSLSENPQLTSWLVEEFHEAASHHLSQNMCHTLMHPDLASTWTLGIQIKDLMIIFMNITY